MIPRFMIGWNSKPLSDFVQVTSYWEVYLSCSACSFGWLKYLCYWLFITSINKMCNTLEWQSSFYSLLNSLWLVFIEDLIKWSRIGKKSSLHSLICLGFFVVYRRKLLQSTARSKKGIDTRFLLAARAENVSISPATGFFKKLDTLDLFIFIGWDLGKHGQIERFWIYS